MGADDGVQRLEQRRAARQPIQPDNPHGLGGQRRRGLLLDRGPRLPVRGHRVGPRPRLQGRLRLGRPSLLRRNRQLPGLREQDLPDDRVRLPEARHRHGRPAQGQQSQGQVPGQGAAARRHGLPAVPGLRRRAQLPAEQKPQDPGQAEEARTEGPLVLHPHHQAAQDVRPSRRGQDPADAQGLPEHARAKGRLALHHLQAASLLPHQQSVLSAGYLP